MAEASFILQVTLTLCSAFCLARLVLPAACGLERVLATLAGLAVVALPTATWLGACGLLTPAAALAADASVALALLLLVRRAKHNDAHEPPTAARTSWIEWATFGAAIAVAAALALPIFANQLLRGYRPQWDDLSYHAPMAAHWLQAEHLSLAPYSYHAYYPGNGELFAAWFMLPTRLDAYAALAGAYWLLVCALGVAQLGMRLGAGRVVSAASVALVFFCKPFADQARSFAAVDLAGAAMCLAAAALAAGTTREEPEAMTCGRAFYAGCLAGLAFGTKVTYLPISLPLLAWLLLERRPGPRKACMLSLLFCACALVCGGYFYARNFALAQNPFFPADLGPFSGPLDALTRKTTSLLFQLDKLAPESVPAVLRELLDWPEPVAYAFLGGYAATALALLWPRLYRSAEFRRALLLLVTGLLLLVVAAAGPFSGTANSRSAHLQIRLRFFSMFALFGFPLLAYWLGRSARLRPWLGALAALAIGQLALGWPRSLYVPALGGALGIALPLALELLPRSGLKRFLRVSTFVSFVAGPSLLMLAMRQKEPENVSVMRAIVPAWNAVDALPPGVRVTWFSTFESYKYYRAFGPGLIHVPVAVLADGTPYVFMHEAFNASHSPWWRARKKKAKSAPPPEQVLSETQPEPTEPKAQSASEAPPDLLANLRAQHIEYALVMRKPGGPWPGQFGPLSGSPLARPVARNRGFVLFRLLQPPDPSGP